MLRRVLIRRPAMLSYRFGPRHIHEPAVSLAEKLVKEKSFRMDVDDIDPSKIDTDPWAMHRMLSVALMREYCKKHGLAAYGNKKILVNRIREHWGLGDPTEKTFFNIKLSDTDISALKDNNDLEQIARLTNVEVQLNEEKSILVITGSSECIVKARQEIKELLSYETKTLKYLGDIKSIIPIVSESCRVQVRDGKKKQYTFIGERTSDLTQAQRTIESLIALSERPVSPLILTSEHASSGPVFNIYPVADTLDAPAWRHIPMFRPRLGANLPRLPDSPTSNYLSHGASLTLGSLSDAINQLKPSTGGRLRLGHLAFYPSITHGTSFKGLPLAGKSLQLKDVALWMHESGPKARLMPSIMRNYQNSLLEDAKVESRKDQVELVLRKGVAEEIESAENFLHVTLDVTSNGFELVSAQTTGSRRTVNFIDLDDGLDMQWRDAPKIDDKLVAAIKQLMNYVNSEGLDNLGTICMNGENYGRVFIKNKSVTSFNTRNELYRLQIIQSTVDGILSATEQPVSTAIEVEPLGDNLAAVVAHVRRSMKR